MSIRTWLRAWLKARFATIKLAFEVAPVASSMLAILVLAFFMWAPFLIRDVNKRQDLENKRRENLSYVAQAQFEAVKEYFKIKTVDQILAQCTADYLRAWNLPKKTLGSGV